MFISPTPLDTVCFPSSELKKEDAMIQSTQYSFALNSFHSCHSASVIQGPRDMSALLRAVRQMMGMYLGGPQMSPQAAFGGFGNDRIGQRGGWGEDVQGAGGGPGNDVIRQRAGHGNDYQVARGGWGNDCIVQRGGSGDDVQRARGGPGDDVIRQRGGHGNDRLVANGGCGNDRIVQKGGAGDDRVVYHGSQDHVNIRGGKEVTRRLSTPDDAQRRRPGPGRPQRRFRHLRPGLTHRRPQHHDAESASGALHPGGYPTFYAYMLDADNVSASPSSISFGSYTYNNFRTTLSYSPPVETLDPNVFVSTDGRKLHTDGMGGLALLVDRDATTTANPGGANHNFSLPLTCSMSASANRFARVSSYNNVGTVYSTNGQDFLTDTVNADSTGNTRTACSGDGRYVAYLSTSGVKVIDTQPGGYATRSASGMTNCTELTISGDGKTLAWTAGGQIHVVKNPHF